MKKIVATFLLLSTFTIVPSMPAVAAETSEMVDEFVLMEMEMPSEAGAFKPCPAGTFKVRRHTRTKKKLLNAAITSGIGAAIGAGVGGGRGALLGAGAGAGGYLTYRYIRDRRGRCVRRYS
jgi:hypothetical protein